MTLDKWKIINLRVLNDLTRLSTGKKFCTWTSDLTPFKEIIWSNNSHYEMCLY